MDTTLPPHISYFVAEVVLDNGASAAPILRSEFIDRFNAEFTAETRTDDEQEAARTEMRPVERTFEVITATTTYTRGSAVPSQEDPEAIREAKRAAFDEALEAIGRSLMSPRRSDSTRSQIQNPYR